MIGSEPSAAEDDKVTLAEFTTHILDTYDLIETLALGYATALKRTVVDGVSVIDYYVAYQREGFAQFTDNSGGACESTCQAFRGNIVELIHGQQAVLNLVPQAFGALAKIRGLEPPPRLPPADLSPLVTVLENAPAYLLYPLYDGIKQLTGDANGALDYMNLLYDEAERALTSIVEVGDLVPASASAPQQLRSMNASMLAMDAQVNSASCQVMTDADSLRKLLAAVPILRTFSGILNVIGDYLIAVGLRNVKEVRGELSLVGELGTAFDTNEVGTFGEILRLLGAVSEGFGDALFKWSNRCRIRLNNQVMFCMLTSKNMHSNPKEDTHQDCLDAVEAGNTPFGFHENWLSELNQELP